MNDPKKHERRQRVLRERRAAENREFDRAEAWCLYQMAVETDRGGDAAGAARTAKRALQLDPDLLPALDLLARLHFAAAEYDQAIACLQLLRKHPEAVSAGYNLAQAYSAAGRAQEAIESYREFLEATHHLRGRQWKQLRENARMRCAVLEKPAAPAVAAPPPRQTTPKPKQTPPHKTAAPPRPDPPPPRVSVDFLPAAEPVSKAAGGSLVDYLLRRRLLELRVAQSFENLICLASLHGVDTYLYQQETVRRVLRHFKGRALLADEVGLGKTIEACLVLKEYWARGMARRVLVLTPPSLVSQWKGELAEKFGLAPASPDSAAFRSNPAGFWRNEPVVVASIAMARLEPHASMLAATAWDMVIVDEAHCLKNRASANWKLVNSLTKKFILMLTATPVENNLLELYNLITVLKPGLLATEADFRKQFLVPGKPRASRDPDRLRGLLCEVMVRNTRSGVDVRLPPRIAASVVVGPSPAEAKLYGLVSDYVAKRYRAAKEDARGGRSLALHLLQRQAGSSAPALGRAVGRMLVESDALSAADRRELAAIQEIADQVSWTGKGLQLGRMLSERDAKTVVFTEFSATLAHLAGICAEHSVPYARFSGEMSKPEKDAAIAAFRDEARVLLSTGSGGEGRNLQFANTVINFDLPWNPMRLEQRVGRVHRIGQQQEVFVFNFCQADTVEEQLLRVLHDKINMFELVVGEVDAILGNLDEGDFAALVLELWLSGRDTGRVGETFDDWAERLIAAKRQYSEAKQLDEALFQRDFEV